MYDFCTYLLNGGFGPKLHKKNWYVTNQFMLSMLFHNRMKKYECLTNSSVIASAIYVPYYPGLDIVKFQFDDFNETIRDATALDFVAWVRNQTEWARMMGRDHFFVSGRITWDFRRRSKISKFLPAWGSNLLELPEARNMTTLIVESNSKDDNDIAIPYPTHFHPSNDHEVSEWQEQVMRSTRRYLFAFGGAPRPYQVGSIREKLISQCKNAVNNSCKLIDCNIDDVCNNATNSINIYMESNFCLQPVGDSYTRRSTFDSILAGCIPVFFHPMSAYNLYLWYFPKNPAKYSVYIPPDGINNGTVSVGEILSKISDNDISVMREEVIRLIPKIIYAQHKLETIDDAFEVAVKGVLERIKLRKLREGFDKRWGQAESINWQEKMESKSRVSSS